MRRDIDIAVQKIAIQHHGVFHLGEVERLGGDRALVHRRVMAGRWHRITPHVLSPTPLAHLDMRGLARAATLTHPLSVVSGRTAAVLHGLGPYQRVAVEITAPFAANARGWGYTVRRCRHFDEIEHVVIDELDVMSVSDTLLDLARREPRVLVQRITEEALLMRAISLAELNRAVGNRIDHRCPGGSAMAAVVDSLAGKAVPESRLERACQELLAGASDIPPVSLQVRLPWRSRVNGRVDFVIEPWKLIIECDGRRWHAREQSFDTDRARDNAAMATGWRVLRFTHRMLTADPEGCVELVRSVGKTTVPAPRSLIAI